MSGYAAIRGALVGKTDAGNRVYRRLAPQGAALPYVVMQRISAVPSHTFDAPGDTRPERFQITAWAKDAETADRMGRTIEDALENLGDPSVQASFTDGLGEDEDGDLGGEGKAYAVRIEAELWTVAEA